MGDDRDTAVLREPPLISLREDDVRFWSQALGCTEQDLREALDVAGPASGDVMEFLAPTRW